MTTNIALLRGINVGAKNRLAMADLRQLCHALGYAQVQTFIQSGNIVLSGSDDEARIENALEQGIAEQFGLRVPVIVRTAEQWRGYLASLPFQGAALREPEHVLLGLSKAPLRESVLPELRARASEGEEIEVVADALWIFFAHGIARSKVTSAVMDRAAGSCVTARNWKTVLQLAAMTADRAEATPPKSRRRE